MVTALNLPAEQDLEADAAVSAADAAEVAEVENAAAAVEEGDELDVGEEAAESACTTEAIEGEAEATDPSPATEPDEPAAEVPDATLSPSAPSSAIATRPPARPPQPTALAAFEFNRANAVDEYIGATLECQKLEEAYKRAKKRMEAARDALVEIENDRPDEDEWDSEYVVERGPVAGPARVVGPAPPTAPVEVVDCTESPALVRAVSDAWRHAPTSSLDLNIPRFGPKRREKLLDACPTIGDLEDRRAKPDGLLAIDGIGREFADAIEDRLIAWLSKNRDAEVLAAASNQAVETLANATEASEEVSQEIASEAATTSTEAAEEVVAEPEASGDASAGNARSDNASDASATSDDGDARWYANIEHRAREIMAAGDNCLDEQLDPDEAGGGWWSAGYEQFNAGVNLIECPVVPGPERDDWIRGWMSAKILHDGGWHDAETAGEAK